MIQLGGISAERLWLLQKGLRQDKTEKLDDMTLTSCSYLNWRHSIFWDGELPGVSSQLSVVQQWRMSVVQRGRLPVVCHRRVPVIHRRLSVICERWLSDVWFHILPRLHLGPVTNRPIRMQQRSRRISPTDAPSSGLQRNLYNVSVLRKAASYRDGLFWFGPDNHSTRLQ